VPEGSRLLHPIIRDLRDLLLELIMKEEDNNIKENTIN
jgi:hypothetical protein